MPAVGLLVLILLLPFLGAAFIGLVGLAVPRFRKQQTLIGAFATLMVAVPFGILLATFGTIKSGQPIQFELFDWLAAGQLSVSFAYSLDSLSLTMGLIITGVGALIHVYSMGYMKGDAGYYKYFAYLNLFIFAMLNLVVGDNLLVTFLGWEGVGVCSYFLIGFWFTDMAKAQAAQKAFIANRIGDFAYLIAMFVAVWQLGDLSYSAINGAAASGNLGAEAAFWIGLLIFIAATGKSAQIPLFVWLPDAMAGPTPVSALIHAATMVTAGVYVIARLSPVFVLTPQVSLVIGVVAALTALLAALIALTQNDIKKVLAYSTVSQLGFMFMALAAGAYTTAIFHVMTHAFFKACLFLGSGSVIHAMEHTHAVDDPQDIRTMGGLGKYMKITSITFWISTLAIAGLPLTSGFFSKDEILASVFAAGAHESLFYIIYGVGIFAALLTALYMTRLTVLTFSGKPRFKADEHPPHESPFNMTLPLIVLAVLALVAGFINLPLVIGHGEYQHFTAWLRSAVVVADHHLPVSTEWALLGLSSVVASVGILAALKLYRKRAIDGDRVFQQAMGPLYRAASGKFFVDELYQKLILGPLVGISRYVLQGIDRIFIDGVVTLTGWGFREAGVLLSKLQSGLAQRYALWMTLGAVVMLLYLVMG